MRIHKIKHSWLLPAFLLPVLFTSCISKKKLAKQNYSSEIVEVSDIKQQMIDSSYHFEWLSIKANVNFKKGKNSQSFTANMRMRKSQMIWTSISALSLEAARIKAFDDSIIVLNRMQKTYSLAGNEYLSEILGIKLNVENAQNLLLGNFFSFVSLERLHDVDIDKEGFYEIATQSKRKEKKETDVKPSSKMYVLMHPKQMKIVHAEAQDNKAKIKVEVNYENFKRLKGGLLPHLIHFEAKTKNEPVYVDIEFTKVTEGNPQEFPLEIPKNYKRIQF